MVLIEAGGAQHRPGRDAPDTAGVPFPPPLAYLAGFAAGIALEAAMPVANLPTAGAVAAGIAAGASLLLLDSSAMIGFRRAGTSVIPFKPATALVTGGPYRLTRNPMYLGMAVTHALLALATGVIWALATLPFAVLAIDRLVIAREEPYLERRFGAAYRDYRARVRRWI